MSVKVDNERTFWAMIDYMRVSQYMRGFQGRMDSHHDSVPSLPLIESLCGLIRRIVKDNCVRTSDSIPRAQTCSSL